MTKTIVLMLDAFRRDYVSKENTPFLYNLTRKFGLGQLNQPFGFKNTFGFYTGFHPRKLDQFVYYGFDSKKDTILNSFTNSLLNLFPIKIAFYIINFLRYFKGNKMFIPSIKLKYLKIFSILQKKHFYQKSSMSVKTIFDIFREKNIKYLYYDFPFIIKKGKSKLHFSLRNNDGNRVKKFLKILNKEYGFYYIHLWDLDIAGHKYGPQSKKIKEFLKKQDILVKKILSNFDLQKDNVLLWSDHGMLEIKKIFDLKSKLPFFGHNYIYFLDSTMARFWFFNENRKKQVLEILKQFKEGRILSKQDKQKLGVNFKHNFYGDEIFLAKPGFLICPNFFQDKPCKGMHGYDLSDKNEKAFFIINKKFKKRAKTADLFPTVLELMNLKNPPRIEGRSLLKS